MQGVVSPLLSDSDGFAEDPASLVASACKMKLEGITGEGADALREVDQWLDTSKETKA
jgi:bifunctional non-homologous end joining protein LigD